MRSCASCAAPIDDQDARFCGECGTPVAPEVVIDDQSSDEPVYYVDDAPQQPPVMVIGADEDDVVPSSPIPNDARSTSLPPGNVPAHSPSAPVPQPSIGFRIVAMMALFLGLLTMFWGFLIVARFVSQDFGEIGLFTWCQGVAGAVGVALAIRALRGDRAGCYFAVFAFIAIFVALFSAYRVHSIYEYLVY